MDILSVNAGYFLGFEGTHVDYIRDPGRIFSAEPEEEKQNLKDFVELVRSRNPDMVLLQEIDTGSFRACCNQVKHISQNLPERFQVSYANKYRGFLRSMPLLRKMGNAVMYTRGEVRNHKLAAGRKGLVQEIVLDEFSIYSVHLATLGQWPRRRQIRKLSDLIRDEYVIAGDHNFHRGQKEIDYMEKTLDCKVETPGPTFPAKNPDQKLDLAAHSKNIDVNTEKLGNRFSDHQPVYIEIG